MAKEGALLPVHPAPGAAVPVLRHQPGDGPDADRARARFYWVSQVGMLAGTIVYVNAGTQLAKIESLRASSRPDCWSPSPCWACSRWRRRRSLDTGQGRARRWRSGRKPERFDRNLVVIGAGSRRPGDRLHRRRREGQGDPGREAPHGRRLPQHRLRAVEGADPLRQAAVPHPARAAVRHRRGERRFRFRRRHGARAARGARPSNRTTRSSATRARRRMPAGRGKDRRARGPGRYRAGGRRPTQPDDPRHRHRRRRAALRAADSRASRKSATSPPTTSGACAQLPRRLVVLGGGPIGCELAQAFARFGSQVTQVEMLPRLMMREDPEVSELVAQRFRAEGVDVLLEPQGEALPGRGRREGPAGREHARQTRSRIAVRRRCSCAVGRVANTAGYGLEELGIPHHAARTVETNEYLQTLYPEHLRLRRRRRPLPVHPHRGAPGLVRGGQCAVRHASASSRPTTR
ncbi:MAG: FAD-dependent oxidoreductase [Comamonadaceae bacterium]|nr:FAD-dependent oxidoreductase [Comamonadaceae bacterium]